MNISTLPPLGVGKGYGPPTPHPPAYHERQSRANSLYIEIFIRKQAQNSHTTYSGSSRESELSVLSSGLAAPGLKGSLETIVTGFG